jgi:hypothetical protein
MLGLTDHAFAPLPSDAAVIRSIAPVRPSRAKMSMSSLVSPGASSADVLANAITPPSPLMAGQKVWARICPPSRVTEARCIAGGRGNAKSAVAGRCRPVTTTCRGVVVEMPAAEAATR